MDASLPGKSHGRVKTLPYEPTGTSALGAKVHQPIIPHVGAGHARPLPRGSKVDASLPGKFPGRVKTLPYEPT